MVTDYTSLGYYAENSSLKTELGSTVDTRFPEDVLTSP